MRTERITMYSGEWKDGRRLVTRFDELKRRTSEVEATGRYADSLSWGARTAECRELAFVMCLENSLDDEQASRACEAVLDQIVSKWPATRPWYLDVRRLGNVMLSAFATAV